MADPKRVYRDSCVFIDTLQQTKERIARCHNVIANAMDGKVQIITSAVTLAEVCRVSDSSLPIEDACKLLRQFFEQEYFHITQVTRSISQHAQELAIRHKMTPLDAIHVATALEIRASEIHTFDGGGKRRKGLIKWDRKIGSPAIAITIPPAPPPSIFDVVDEPEAPTS